MEYFRIKTEDATLVKTLKNKLESTSNLNKSLKIAKSNGVFQIHTTLTEIDELEPIVSQYESKVIYDTYLAETGLNTPTTLVSIVEQYCSSHTIPLTQDLIQLIPKKWSVYPPMILFGSNTFDSQIWQSLLLSIDSNDFFLYILSLSLFASNHSKLTHIAINKPIIESDVMRRPFNIRPIFGDFGPLPTNYDSPVDTDFSNAFWCTVVQNGIYQTWAPYYTMFSRGNIKEKARILDTYTDIKNNVVVDLYCGIGYFSLSYLKRGAKQLFCWDLNPWSIEGFRRAINGKYLYKIFRREDNFDYQIYKEATEDGTQVFIFQESNEHCLERLTTFPKNSLPIAHINLGLLPSSQNSWRITQKLKDDHSSQYISTFVHIHENVHVAEFDTFKSLVSDRFPTASIGHLETVKTFAPDVWHIVLDIKL